MNAVATLFPFTKFFEDAPQPLFKGKSLQEDLDVADSCFIYIKHIFDELEEFRAFELLRSGLDRSKYLLVKEAKIIAMTCTHAALKRKELVDMGKYRMYNVFCTNNKNVTHLIWMTIISICFFNKIA